MNIIKVINEEISAITKDNKKEIFDYHSITSDAWHEKVKAAKEFQKISFDLENNDTTGQKKTFYVKKNLRKDQPVKYEFNAELMMAGGDWEMPVMYFRLEFTHDYFYGNNKYNDNPKYVWDLDKKYQGLYKCYVIIPPNEGGNKLRKGEKSDNYEWYAYDNNEISKVEEKSIRIKDEDKNNAWKWLKNLLENLVEERHEMLD